MCYRCILSHCIALLLCGLVLVLRLGGGPSVAGAASGPVPSQSPWQTLEPGLEHAEFERDDANHSRIVVLRFDTARFVFALYMAGAAGHTPQTLRQWAEQHDLVAAINASMYLPDNTTSTGYMRSGANVNNGRIVERFGAFFVADTDDASLPPAALLDRDADPWQDMLPKYRIVIQNYRMTDAQRRILWAPGGPLYSISAVGQDTQGRILFIHCREPVEAYIFAQHILDLPLDARTLMYVEGGGQAGLALRSKNHDHTWEGRPRMDFRITGNVNAPLPNVIGVKRREAAPEK